MKLSLDDLDHKILQILETDGRAPAKTIAEQLSVNEVTVSKRLTKIIEGGFCKIIAIADFEGPVYLRFGRPKSLVSTMV